MKNIARITFYVLTIISLYFLLNKKGYLPPINYFLTREITTDDLQVVSSTDLLNNYLPITKIISTPIQRSQIKILIQKSQFHLTIYYNIYKCLKFSILRSQTEDYRTC